MSPEKFQNKQLIDRPSLIDRIDRGFADGAHLALLCAPAGYGKTSLALQWTTSQKRKVAWLPLSRALNNFDDFLSQMADRLALVGEGHLSHSKLEWLQRVPTTDADFLVLDDYHLIENSEIHDFLIQLLEQRTSTLKLVMTSRNSPPLRLARMRVNRQLTEIGKSELKFRMAELREIVERSPHSLTDAEIEHVYQKTEGWGGLLQLALSSVSQDPGQSFLARLNSWAKDSMDLRHYLLEEVSALYSKEKYRFLLVVSLFDEISEELYRSLSVGPWLLDQETLDSFHMSPVSSRDGWYKLHSLYALELRRRAKVDLEVHDLRKIHGHASTWFEQNSHFERADQHAVLGENWSRTERLLETRKTSLKLLDLCEAAIRAAQMGSPDSEELYLKAEQYGRQLSYAQILQEEKMSVPGIDATSGVQPTPQEYSILRLLDEGLSNRQIAERLYVSVSTVKWHNRSLYLKLGVSNRTAAVKRGRELKLL